MNAKPYEKHLPVKLTTEEIDRRRAQHMLAPLALEAHAETVAAESDAWTTAKAARKTREAELVEAGKKIVRDMCTEARVLRDGVELQPVTCEDTIDGGRVVTRRLDTGEEIDARRAKPDELKAWDEAPAPPRKDPTPEEIHDRLAAAIQRICSKPREPKWLDAQLTSACREASAEDRKRAVTLQLEAARLVEDEKGKLLWIGHVPAPAAAPNGTVATH